MTDDGGMAVGMAALLRVIAERDAAIARAEAAEATIAAVRALVDTPKGTSTLCICEYTDRLSECQDHLDLVRILIRRVLDTGATT